MNPTRNPLPRHAAQPVPNRTAAMGPTRRGRWARLGRFSQAGSLLALVIALGACGGGGSGSDDSALSGAGADATSSGTITAFGSVYVNGHKFNTDSARVVDDDTGAVSTGSDVLEVGMVVDVRAASHSHPDRPVAAELRVHPLARGVVDASDGSSGTLKVMGQTVQLTAATVFSDRRSCVEATTDPCTAVSSQAELTATTGSGTGAVAGDYVVVHGYLYAPTTDSSSAQIVATLVSLRDSSSETGATYKAEGVVSEVNTTARTLTVGGLTVDYTQAACYKARSNADCASAFSVGQVVSAYSASMPALPVSQLTADVLRVRSKTVVETEGATVELEGKVASVNGSQFVLRGMVIDAASLSSGSLPVAGDVVRVLGVVASGGTQITASSVTLLRPAAARAVGLEGDYSSLAAGSTAQTYVVTLLGQRITVDAETRLADRSSARASRAHRSSNPFNIGTFESYLAAATTKQLRIAALDDGSGNLRALSLTLVADTAVSGVAGTASGSDNTGNPVQFTVHGVAVQADTSAIVARRTHQHGNDSEGDSAPEVTAGSVSDGQWVVVRGSLIEGTLVVSPPASGSAPGADSIVVNFGTPGNRAERDCF
jgi:hypothetical protein